MIIKETIKEQMEYWNMSQNDLVLKSGIDQKGLSDIANGKREVTIETSTKIGRAFGLDSNALFRMQEHRKEVEMMRKDKDLNIIANYLDTMKRYELLDPLTQLRYAVKFIKAASFSTFKDYVNSKVIGKKSYKDKTLAYFWIALMENNHGAKMSDKKFVKTDGNKVIDSVIRTILSDTVFEIKINKVKALLHDAGVVLNNGPFIPDSTIYGVSFLRNRQRHIFMSDMGKRECKYIFTLIHELVRVYGKNGLSESEVDEIAAKKIKKIMKKENITNKDMEILFDAYETKNFDSIYAKAKSKINFGKIEQLLEETDMAF